MSRLLLFTALILAFTIQVASAQTNSAKVIDYAPVTAVVYNSSVPESKALAEFYCAQRGIPTANLVGLDCPEKETISRQEYQAWIRDPLRKQFTKRGWWKLGEKDGAKIATSNKIKIVALMRHVPLRIAEQYGEKVKDPETGQLVNKRPAQLQQNQSSVDSELILLGWYDLEINSAHKNRYYGQDVPFGETALPWMVLVGRIDAPTDAGARRLITDAIAAEKTGLWGKAYVDLAQWTQGSYIKGETWIKNVAATTTGNGIPTIVDPHKPRFADHYPMEDCAIYMGWYSQRPDGPFTNPRLKLRQGAIATHLYSFSATSLRANTWVSTLLNRGAAAVLGNVYEPYLTYTHQLDLFVARMLQGYTFAEASHMAIPTASWMAVAVGDPLYRPFRPQAGLPGDPKVDADYKAHKIAYLRWGRSDPKTFRLNLVKGAVSLNSGNLFEALGLSFLESDNTIDANTAFEKAAAIYTDPRDVLRQRILQAEIIRTTNPLAAAAYLRGIRDKFASIPEVKALDALVLTMDPPPPPPPAAPPQQ